MILDWRKAEMWEDGKLLPGHPPYPCGGYDATGKFLPPRTNYANLDTGEIRILEVDKTTGDYVDTFMTVPPPISIHHLFTDEFIMKGRDK